MKLDDVAGLLEIDTNDLSGELMRQPQLMYDVGIAHASAMSARDSAKDKLTHLEAQTAEDVRKRLASGRGKPPTEKMVSEAIDADSFVVDARAGLTGSASEARKWDAAVSAARAKGFAIHKLVEMQDDHMAAISSQAHKPDDETQEYMSSRHAH